MAATTSTPTADDAAIIDLLLVHEGSAYTNDPADAGGPTRWGITQANLASWRGHVVTPADVQALTRDEAAAIYRAQYLRPFDQLRPPLRVNVIDMGVNAGVRRATVLLQQLVGVEVDGWIGPQTVAAVATRDLAVWNVLYVGMRLHFYEELIVRLPNNQKWRHGWRARALSFLAPIPATLPAPTARASVLMAKAA